MVERRRREVDPAALLDQLGQLGRHRPVHQRHVAAPGQHDLHVDAAQRGDVQGAQHLAVGQEVRCHDAGAPRRDRQRAEQDLEDVVDVAVRAVRHAARRDRAVPPHRREPALALEAFARREGPVVRERVLHVGDDRAVDAEVNAADRMRGRAREPVARADVHAAREADLAVDHEDLAVHAQVGVLVQARHAGRQERRDGHSGIPQPADHRGLRVTRAHVVDQHPGLDAARPGAHQRVEERLARGVVVEDVADQRDRGAGGVDRGEHGRERGVPVLQRHDAVPVEQRIAGDLLAEPGEARERRMTPGKLDRTSRWPVT